jgi:hypothetical protein
MSRRSPRPLSNVRTGNFDFQVGSSSSSSSPSNASYENLPETLSRLQALRTAMRQQREQDQARRDAEAAERRRAEQRRTRRRLTAGSQLRRAPRGDVVGRLPTPPTAPRRSGPPGDRFHSLRRRRQYPEYRSSFTRSPGPISHGALDEHDDPWNTSGPEVAAFLDPGVLQDTPPLTPSGDTDVPPSERRRKRRKLSHDTESTHFRGFKYGHCGQVVPGRLKMEISSCDGGELEDTKNHVHRMENVLRNDTSVYCTKNSQCNILLRHQGETTFCLEKLVIKRPESGFSAPYVYPNAIILSHSWHFIPY